MTSGRPGSSGLAGKTDQPDDPGAALRRSAFRLRAEAVLHPDAYPAAFGPAPSPPSVTSLADSPAGLSHDQAAASHRNKTAS